MHLNGVKISLILCFSGIIIPYPEVLSSRNNKSHLHKNIKQHNKNKAHELNLLSEFLDYNHLNNVLIIYTPNCADIWQIKGCKCCNNSEDIKLIKSPIIQKLTENYHMQFANSFKALNNDYLFAKATRQVLVFMKYFTQNEGKKNILKLTSHKQMFNGQFVWLLVMEEMQDSRLEIQNTFRQFNFMINTDFTVAIRSKLNNDHYDLYDLYKICHNCGSPLEIEYKGNWTVDKGLHILKKSRFGIAARRRNLKKYPIKAATAIVNKSPNLNMSDLEYLNNDKDRLEEDTMQRKTFQLMNNFLYLYNATFNVTIETSWGAEVNGSWTGVRGLLERNETELSLCPLRYAAKRVKILVFTSNIHYEKIHFIFRHPKHTSIRNIFLEPFVDIVWWCVLVLIVITILLLAIHVHIEYKVFMKFQKQQQQHTDAVSIGSDSHNASVVTSTAAKTKHFNTGLMMVENHFDFIVLCIIEAIFMQGPAPELFRSNSTRLLILSVSVFSILLMQFYGAFIVSSLLSEPPRTINNLQALYNSSLELGMENISYNYEVFINNTNPLVHNVYKYRICNKLTNRRNIMSLEEGVRRVGAGNFAFHVAIDRAYRLLKSSLTESQFCDLQEIMFNPPHTFYSGLGIRHQSPYYEFITRAVIIFYETALLPYNNKKWEVGKIDCSAVRGDEVEVDLEHFAPALAFLLFAYIISLFVLFVEIVYRKLESKKFNLYFN